MSIAEKLKTIAENSPKVYEAGKAKQEDDFWYDVQTRMKEQSDSTYAFPGATWTDNNFNPVMDLSLRGNSNYAFASNAVTDYIEKFDRLGIRLDLSAVTSAMNLFYYSKATRLPELNFSNSTTCSALLMRATSLMYVEKIILSEKCKNVGSMFDATSALEHCIFEGEIATGGMVLKNCKLLDKESITSLINTLSTTTSGLTVTLSQTAVNNAFETESGKADGSTSQEWLDLRNTKSNWTISLV